MRVDPIERERAAAVDRAAPGARRASASQRGDEGQRTLAFFADRVEGNLLAAHQEIQKLALLHPRGELSFEQVEAAVLNVARYDVFKLGEAVLAGQVARALRMLDGLRAEGEAPVLVHWTLAEDIRALKRVRGCAAQTASRCRWRCARRASGASRSGCSSARCRCCADHAARATARGGAGLRRPRQGAEASGLAARPLGCAAAARADDAAADGGAAGAGAAGACRVAAR